MEEWKETGKGKKIKILCNGAIAVISPTNTINIIPLFCPCCKRPMKTSDDGLAFRKQGVCYKCDERWTNKPNILWPYGPDKNSKEWAEYIDIRNLLEKPLLDFK